MAEHGKEVWGSQRAEYISGFGSSVFVYESGAIWRKFPTNHVSISGVLTELYFDHSPPFLPRMEMSCEVK